MYRNNRQITKKDDEVLKSGFTRGQTWGALEKAWFAYMLSDQKDNIDNKKYYAAGIQKLEHELGVKVYSFHELKMSALAFYSNNAKYLTGEETGEEILEKMIQDKQWTEKLKDDAANERFTS